MIEDPIFWTLAAPGLLLGLHLNQISTPPPVSWLKNRFSTQSIDPRPSFAAAQKAEGINAAGYQNLWIKVISRRYPD